jgi:hypothetical protein
MAGTFTPYERREGALQAASPLAFWWLEPRTVYALGLTLIAAVYIGFGVADGRWHVIAIESSVAGLFVVVAALSVSASAWLLVLGLAGHGLKDLWQHRTHFVPEHALVATVLRHGRLGRRRNPRRRTADGNFLGMTGSTYVMSPYGRPPTGRCSS